MSTTRIRILSAALLVAALTSAEWAFGPLIAQATARRREDGEVAARSDTLGVGGDPACQLPTAPWRWNQGADGGPGQSA